MNILIKKVLLLDGQSDRVASIHIHNDRIAGIIDSCVSLHEGKFDEVIDASGKIALPGLINAHIHSYGNLVKGLSPTIPLEGWMLYIMEQGALMDAEDCYWNAMLGAVEMIKTGTVCVMDHLFQPFAHLDSALQAYRDIGIRAVMAPMIADKSYFSSLALDEAKLDADLLAYRGPDWRTIVTMVEKLIAKWHDSNGTIQVGFGPSGPQRCSDDLLRACAQKAEEYDTVLHSHVLETLAQAEAAQKLYGTTMMGHLQEIGVLSSRFSYAHGVHLTDEEIKLAAATGSICVHNPAVNFLLGSGVAAVDRYRHLGARVALGTDGANGSGNLNMFESIKGAATIHNTSPLYRGRSEKWITPQEVLYMATVESAAACNLGNRCGRLQPGYSADIVLIDPAASPTLAAMSNPLWQLTYSCPAEAVEMVFIAGRKVMEDRKILLVSEQRVVEEAQRRARKIADKFNKEGRTKAIELNALLETATR